MIAILYPRNDWTAWKISVNIYGAARNGEKENIKIIPEHGMPSEIPKKSKDILSNADTLIVIAHDVPPSRWESRIWKTIMIALNLNKRVFIVVPKRALDGVEKVLYRKISGKVTDEMERKETLDRVQIREWHELEQVLHEAEKSSGVNWKLVLALAFFLWLFFRKNE